MNQQQQDIFGLYDSVPYSTPASGRSPPSSRAYSQHTLNRQTSRHFENYEANPYNPVSQMPQSFQGNGRNGTSRFEGMNGTALQPPNSYTPTYDTNSWNNMGSGMQQTQSSMNGVGSQVPLGMSMAAATLGASNRMRPQTSRRPPLPAQWMDQPQAPTFDRNGPRQAYGGNPSQIYDSVSHTEGEDDGEGGEDLIPTAIVIKNIPFAVKKEQLTDIMSKNNLPLPYAFNYHFDTGVFRGLAFANFSNPEETRQVIQAMNHMEISGRKLRVEYKKMLPVRERERIEREKRERRGQLEEQHRPVSVMLHNQSSMSSLAPHVPSTSPSPSSQRAASTIMTDDVLGNELDMNDQVVLKYYSELVLFIADQSREVMVFPETLPPDHRRIIHTLAHSQGLEHKSRGQGEQRQVVLTKAKPTISPPLIPTPMGSLFGADYSRRGLNRAATTDFSSVSRGSNHDYHTLERQASFLGIPNSPSNGFGGRYVREAKSFADLRSHNGSPSLIGYPPMPSVPNYSEVGGMTNGQSGTPSLASTSSNNALTPDDLSTSFNNLGLGQYDRPVTTRSNGGRLNIDQDTHGSATGAIGSHRPSNGNYEDHSRNGGSLVPERQPRIPGYGAAPFSARGRQNGLSSRGDASSDTSGRF